jgi:membrane protein YqaA with SNARE-associated domain
MIESAVQWLLSWLAVPEVGLTSAFLISFISATLVPLGSEPAVFAVVKADASQFWAVIAVATVGNTLGGVVNYWMGFGAHEAFAKERKTHWFGWLERFGAKAMILTWLPGIGDPISTLGGWLKLPFWPCVAYMAVGKFMRYVVMTWALLHVPDHVWQQMIRWVG